MSLLKLYVTPSLRKEVDSLNLDNIDIQDSPEQCDIQLDFIETKHSDQPTLALTPVKSGAVSIDFIHGKKAHRRQFGGGKGQPLVRAMGKLDERSLRVIDATAGMGNDAFVLSNQGFEVLMIERNPLIAMLLSDAIDRAQKTLTEGHIEALESEIAINNLSLINANAADYLLNHSPEVDTIYMDPMYPEKKKKAAVNKEMALLQALVGPDMDSSALLDAALKTARYRVVVKRPKGAPIIQHPLYQPSTEISSPNTRYDIYVIKALKKRY